mmetsp:Transcript_111803/g.297146  ORF Transcript_111803/g.297146 Transcript_111803/m.297146 type:complete len:325 (+) Transcript_111803:203-1177(+)
MPQNAVDPYVTGLRPPSLETQKVVASQREDVRGATAVVRARHLSQPVFPSRAAKADWHEGGLQPRHVFAIEPFQALVDVLPHVVLRAHAVQPQEADHDEGLVGPGPRQVHAQLAVGRHGRLHESPRGPLPLALAGPAVPPALERFQAVGDQQQCVREAPAGLRQLGPVGVLAELGQPTLASAQGTEDGDDPRQPVVALDDFLEPRPLGGARLQARHTEYLDVLHFLDKARRRRAVDVPLARARPLAVEDERQRRGIRGQLPLAGKAQRVLHVQAAVSLLAELLVGVAEHVDPAPHRPQLLLQALTAHSLPQAAHGGVVVDPPGR